MDVMTFPDRVQARAQQVNVVRLLVSVLMIPFWIVGALVGILFLVVSWAYAACAVGFNDAKAVRRERDG